ncbi:nuclear transport factor 2 family protein [Lentisalinibacter orientalis]|uniref:nuclear transport factor 2 family protein n=1 Tax=Lentisalinibacter orientalis TaxID=2992241 RepID=UPI00386A39FF
MQKLAIVTLLVIGVLAVVLAGLLAWAIRSADVAAPAAHVAAYEEALVRTEGMGPAPGSEAEAAAVARLREFFGELTPEGVQRMAREVYAPDAFFNDTLKTLRGAAAIEEYFLHTAQNADSVQVEFHHIGRSGDDFYFRWRMTMRVGALADGEPLVSWGVTHFRFDDDGRVVLHQDFWDSAGGLYEHIPVIGGLLRAIRARF